MADLEASLLRADSRQRDQDEEHMIVKLQELEYEALLACFLKHTCQ